MTLSKSVATGEPFLGRPVTQGTVLYVRCEDGPAKTKSVSRPRAGHAAYLSFGSINSSYRRCSIYGSWHLSLIAG
jgi:hypothetical protein